MKKISLVLVSLLILCFASTGLGQQTGSLKGTVTDDDANRLPGVTVTITSPQMQGTQSYISTVDGDFRFPTLPPGTYVIRTELPGFQTMERVGVRVRVGSSSNVEILMTPSTLDEEITVTAPSPIVDVEAADIAVTIDQNVLTNIPLKRDILDVYQTAPAGVPRQSNNDYQKSVTVAGGAFHESKISIDGVDLVDPSRGYINSEVAFDAIEEVELVIGGHNAETGQVSAGFLNVVTKSGGNTFSGSITLGGTTDSLTQVVVPQEEIQSFKLLKPQLKEYKYDAGMGFGGPIIKDRIWFFVAPRYSTFKQSTFFIPFTDPDGVHHPEYPNKRDDYIGFGKITAQLTKNLKWFTMFQYNRGKEVPQMWAVTKTTSPLETNTIYDDDSYTTSSVLTYVMNQNTVLEGRFGMVYRTMRLIAGGDWEGPANRAFHNDRYTKYEWGSPIYGTSYNRDNRNFGLVLTRFQDGLLGTDHEIKFGLEYMGGRVDRQRTPSASPYQYNWNRGEPWYFSDTDPYKGQFSIYGGAVKDQYRPYRTGYYRFSGFIQDTFSVGERLTVNIGFRYDNSHGYVPEASYEGWDDTWENGLANVLLPTIFQPAGSSLQTTRLDDIMVFKYLSPRIGLSYDVFGNGATVLKGSFARYGEAMFTSALESMTPLADRTVRFTWWDDNKNGELDLPPIDRYRPAGYSEYYTNIESLRNQIASELDVPYTDELILGMTQRITQDFSISFNGMYKIQDQMLASRNLNIPKNSEWWVPYTVTDPGFDMTLGTGDEKSLTVFMLRSDAPSNFIQKDNIDEAFRKYVGFNMLFNKRMSSGWMLQGSIALSESTSNIRWGYLTYAGWENYWDPNVDINRTGRPENDRPIIIKLMSTVQLPLGFNLSGYFRYLSGKRFERHLTVYFPKTLNGYSPRNASVSINAEAEGSRAFQASSIMDLRLEKSFNFQGLHLGVWAEVFNLFGHWNFQWNQSQSSNAYYHTGPARLTGGYIYANGSVSRYPRWGEPNAVYGTREFAFGARIRF